MFRRQVDPMTPLRVSFVVPDLRFGGAERHVSTLLPALDPARFRPSVVSIGHSDGLFGDVLASGVPARALGRTKRQMLLTLAQLVGHMWRTRPDLVVAWGYNAEMLGRIAAALTGVPRSVVWVHNCSHLGPYGRFRRMVNRVLDPVTSAYFGVAEGQIPYLTGGLGFPRAKVRILYNGVDPDRYRSDAGRDPERDSELARSVGIDGDGPVVGIVAVLRPEKDHATFLRAARIVLDRLPEARFLLVGDGPERENLTRLAADLGIADRVGFAGSRRDVPDLLRLLDVFALTSRSECFPMALLEAMASGRPAVCTGSGGIPEMIEEAVTGHVVPVGDPDALAERLLSLLIDPARAREMGRAARRRLEADFSLDRSVRATELAFERTAGVRAEEP